MKISNYIVTQDQEAIKRCTEQEEAVSAAMAQAKESGRAVSLIAEYAGAPSQEVMFNPDGTNENIWRIDQGRSFAPEEGQVYVNRGGGQYRCTGNLDDGATLYNGAGGYSRTVATFQNIASGWSFIAKGIIRYVDGSIEWDHSCDGRFESLA